MTPNAEFLQAVYSDAQITRDKARERRWILSTVCRYCHKPVSQAEAVVVGTYWWAYKAVAHKACKTEGYQQEALDCQNLDANCNDCKHFNRTKGNHGTCQENHQEGEFTVFPGNWQGMGCFIHRLQNK